MKLMVSSRLLMLVFLTSAFLVLAFPCQSAEQSTTAAETNLENIAPDQVDSVMAKLTDEQVRSLLLAELSKDVPQSSEDSSSDDLFSFVISWLHILDINKDQHLEGRVQKIIGHVVQVPADIAGVFRQFGDDSRMSSAWKHVTGVLVIFLLALGVELLFKKLTASFRRQFLRQGVPELSGYMRLWAGIVREIPSIVHLAIFGGTSLLLFALLPLAEVQSVRLLFMAILSIIIFVRLGIFLSQLVCSPNLASLRLLSVSDSTAKKFHTLMLLLFLYVGSAISFLSLASELGMSPLSLVLLNVCAGTILILIVVGIVLQNRQGIAEYILSNESVDPQSGWVMNQFAPLWHVPVLLYLFVVWLLFIFQRILGVNQAKGEFLISLMVVPLFLLLDRIGHWVVQMTVDTLKIYTVNEDEDTAEEKSQEDGELTPEQKAGRLVVRLRRIVRVVILFALSGWVMSLWGYNLPYAAVLTNMVFESLVTLAVALFFWKVVSGYIERKILEDEPEEEVDEEQDGEWGAAAKRGRSYTLLPMVRKFFGIVLLVMVTLIILSTIGIEIGPLLAGAGVVGLAIGFGAQKLVSDIFSGFFFLLDDAFRVGEYLKAGSVSGAVEAITLRNVMLRHHRGMLQIVPYSDLGPITNFMRGGIVVKFNLEFPYDTDIDKVRKIIKRVGQAMLEDEEFAKDFIQPVKSQGVREIANSVMVIRVKFTAKPGSHFVIRREAYRRITEALADKGIHYAHRKVIVEVPESGEGEAADKQRVAEAGAAAGLAAMAADEEKKAKEGGGS